MLVLVLQSFIVKFVSGVGVKFMLIILILVERSLFMIVDFIMLLLVLVFFLIIIFLLLRYVLRVLLIFRVSLGVSFLLKIFLILLVLKYFFMIIIYESYGGKFLGLNIIFLFRLNNFNGRKGIKKMGLWVKGCQFDFVWVEDMDNDVFVQFFFKV